MKFYVENTMSMENKGFNSLKKACEYAFANRDKLMAPFGVMLVHNGYHNFDYAEMHKSEEELYKSCMAQHKAL